METKRKLGHVSLYCDPYCSLGTRRKFTVPPPVSLKFKISSNMESFDALLKVVTIGDTSVGKTCLILRYTQDIFRENFLSTIGEPMMVSAVGKRSNAGLERRV